MILSIIVAVAENKAIGKNNDLLWDLPVDMKFFKDKTFGHCIITGRKNYESIPEKFRPLPNRTNIVITRQPHYDAPGAIVVKSVEEAIQQARETGDTEIFIIGGAEIYRQTLHLADRIYLTTVHHRFEADAFFPDLDESQWEETDRKHHPADEKNAYSFTFSTLERKH